MRYDDYAQKVEKVAKIKRFIAKNVIAFLIVGIIVGAAAITLTSIKGTVIDKQDSITEIEYGGQIDYEANAIFSSVDYEYCVKGTEEWTSVVPREAGSYLVRAIAKSSFGATRHGEAHEFTITSKAINISVVEKEITFGETPTPTGDTLIPGDHVVCSSYNYGSFAHQNTTVEPVYSGIKILDKDENDVTDSYIITTVQTDIRFKRKSLQLTTATDTKVYDGTSLTNNTYTITGGGLRESDKVNITYKSSITNVGSVYNKADVTITDKDGTDVTINYSVDLQVGTLSVTRRPITIRSLSKDWTYDATSHYCTDFDVEYYLDKALDAQYITVSDYTKVTTITDGTENEILVSISSSDKTIDYTSNYDITYQYGTLKIKKRPLKIETVTDSWIYDGEEHENQGYTPTYFDNNNLGHKLVITSNPSITTVGEKDNNITLKVFYKDIAEEIDVSDNYDIQYTYGKLTVTKRPITITTTGNSWVYDDTEHYETGFTITSGSTPDSQYVEIVSFPKITNVISTDNNISFKVFTRTDSVNVTDNYELTTIYNKIEITKRPIAIVTESDEWYYDNTEHYNNGIKLVEVSGYPLLTNHSLSDITIKTKVTLATSDDGVENKVGFKISKSDGLTITDVTDNYDFEERITYGKLVVKKRPIIIKSGSASKVYDKTALKAPSFTSILNIAGEDGTAIATGDTLFVKMKDLSAIVDVLYDEFGEVTGLKNDIDTDKTQIQDINGNDKLKNYDITYEYGTLTIYPRAIVVTSDSASKIYDNTALSKNTATFALDPEYVYPDELTSEGNAIISGDDYTLEITTSVTNVKFNGKDVVGTDNTITTFNISANYIVRKVAGLLTIYPRPIKITANDASKVYNNTALTEDGYVITLDTSVTYEDGALIPSGEASATNDVITAVTAPETPAITFGTYANKISSYLITETTPEETINKASNYVVAVVDGTLTINKRQITITAGSAEKIFDNTALTKTDDYTVDFTGEAPDTSPAIIAVDILTLTFTDESTITLAGSADNIIKSATLYEDTTDKTENYEITYNKGTLTVLKRAMKATTATNSWVYNNEAFFDHTITLADGTREDSIIDTLLAGLKTAVTNEITVKYVGDGNVQNALTFDILDENDNVITDSFTLDTTYGELSVTKLAVTLTAKSNSKVYDNKDLTEGGFTTSVEIPQGDVVTVTMTSESVARTVKRDSSGVIGWDNEIKSYTIMEGETSKADNYEITTAKGTLTILPRAITITADSASKVYDNKEFSVDTFTAVLTDGSEGNAAAPGDEITITVSGATLTTVGTSHNTITSVTIMEGETPKTDNYEITKVDGTLTISVRKITITADSDKKVYDDTALTKDTYTLSFTAISDPDEDTPSGEVMADGDKLTLSMTAGSTITNKGSVQNVIDQTTVKIINDTTDKLTNYAITYIDGKLEITGKPLCITTKSASKVYDDTDLTETDITVTGDLVSGQSREFDTITTLHNAETKENIVTIKIYKIVASEKVYTTANYDIEYTNGTLTISKRPITIGSNNGEWTYDGTAHTNTTPTVTYPDGYPKLSGHEVTLTECTEVTNITTGTPNTFTPVITNTSTSYVVTDNYEITKTYGTLVVNNTAITISVLGETFTYDGTYHAPTTSVASGTLISGHQVTLINATTRRDATDSSGIDITFDGFKIIDTTKNNKDVTGNYDITTGTVGKFIVNKADITITFADKSKVYDGTALAPDTPTVTGLATADKLNYSENTVTYVGSVNCIDASTLSIISSDQANMTENYNISLTNATLTITVREISIAPKAYSKAYDGKAIADMYTCVLTSDNTKDGAVAGDGLDVVFNSREELINAGSINTSIKSAQFGKNDNCYDITIDYSAVTLTITTRPITITSGTASKEWDGTVLTKDVIKITTTEADGITLVGSDNFTVTLDASQTAIGLTANEFTDADITFTGSSISNYSITKEQGTLTVTQRYIFVYINSTGTAKAQSTVLTQSTDYDILKGTFLTDHVMTVTKTGSGSASTDFSATVMNGTENMTTYYNVQFVTDDNIIVVYVEKDAEVGTLTAGSDYQIVYGSDALNKNNDTLSITKNGANDYTKTVTGSDSLDHTKKYTIYVIDDPNYQEEEDDSDSKTPLTVKPKNRTKTYDGTALTPIELDSISLPTGYRYDVVFSGSQTEVGTSNSSITSFVIYNESDVDVTKNYKITYKTGTLKVTAQTITVRVNTKQATYGETLSFDANGYTVVSGLPTGYTLTMDISTVGSFTAVGTYGAEIFNNALSAGTITYTVMDASSIDKTSSFTVVFEMTTPAQICKKKITVTVQNATKTYDGTPLTSNVVTSTELLSGHRISSVTCDGTITNVGSTTNNITSITILDSSDNDVTDNYSITTVSGKLTIIADSN